MSFKANVREMRKIGEWLQSDNTGSSSKSLAAVALGYDGPIHRPYDPADFHRCMIFLECIDLSRRRNVIYEASLKNEKWLIIHEHWYELIELYNEEFQSLNAPKLYQKMKEIGL